MFKWSFSDRIAIGKPEICDRDPMVIGHQDTALSAGALANKMSAKKCLRSVVLADR